MPSNEPEPVSVDVHYRLRIPVRDAEQLVGRPWVHHGEDDDSWECELEEAVKNGLPDLLREYCHDDPDVEWF